MRHPNPDLPHIMLVQGTMEACPRWRYVHVNPPRKNSRHRFEIERRNAAANGFCFGRNWKEGRCGIF
jgi:hypothetical protein